jgi:hypothetical protein
MMSTVDGVWPLDKLSALRLGRRLVAEVPASRPGRRAFVDVLPSRDAGDGQAKAHGWTRSSPTRTFRLQHWEYDADRIAGYDYDVSAVLLRTACAGNEAELIDIIHAWRLLPDQFSYAWNTDDPR